MNGAHDMGGGHGFGPVRPEPERDEPVFHAPWERRALAITLACGMLGQWSIDMSRFARERQTPAAYLNNSYYETWMQGLETLLVEQGLVTPEELAGITPAEPAQLPAVDANKARQILASGGPTLLDADEQPAFAAGDLVRVVNEHPLGHTRAPRYVRGRSGVIEAFHGVHVFADENARTLKTGAARPGAPLYSVRFTARELWGSRGGEHDSVLVDLWQPYLEIT